MTAAAPDAPVPPAAPPEGAGPDADAPTRIAGLPPGPGPASPAASGHALPLGTRLHEFELTQVLGEGGFGIVYLATDTTLQRQVAIKEYMPSALAARRGPLAVTVRSEHHRDTFAAGLASFINEAQLLARFEHPALVKVYRFWEDHGTAYMAMPYYQGRTLRDTLRQQPAPPTEAWLRALLAPLMDALELIHAQRCYHRDIAPDNVMMLADSGRPVLLDFGAARRVIGDRTQALTVILKPGYAPVEQYAETPGMAQGAWTDVYALAAVVHHAITGRTPPPSVSRLLDDRYRPLALEAAGRYSAVFLTAIDRALAVRPEARTPSIAAFRAELGLDAGAALAAPAAAGAGAAAAAAAAASAPAPKTPAPQPRASAPARGRPWPGRLLVAGLVALLLAAGLWAWQGAAQRKPGPDAAVAVGLREAADKASTDKAAAPAPQAARFEPEREFSRILQAQAGGFGVQAQAPATVLRIGAGDQVRFRVTAQREGHLYAIGHSSDGALALLVPNAQSPSVRLRKGQVYEFPSGDGFFIAASEPTGTSRILVMVSARPRSFDAMAPRAEGPIQAFASGDNATRLLQAHTGTRSLLAGRPLCEGGVGDCIDEYGAALLSFTTQP